MTLRLVIRVRKLSESGSISGHYTGKTDLKLDSLSFLTLIAKLQSHSAGVLCSAKYPCHVEGQIKLLVQRNVTDKSAKLGTISVSPHSFVMPAQILHYFYNAVPSPQHL